MTTRLLIALSLVGATSIAPRGLRAQCHFAKTAPEHTVTYRFHPEATPDGLTLHVTLEFQAGRSGTETLSIPTRWAGETLHALSNLRTTSAAALLVDGADETTKTLRASPHRSVVIA